MMRLWRTCLIALVAVLVAAGTAGAQAQYTITDIGSGAQPNGINDLGQVTGWLASNNRAFIWDSVNGIRSLGTLGGQRSEAYAINNSGEIVGMAMTPDGGLHAFIWDSVAGMQQVDMPNAGAAYDINNTGQLVGKYSAWQPGGYRDQGFIWNGPGDYKALGALGSGTGQSIARSINDSGVVVGYSVVSSSSHAFIWDEQGGMVDLGLIVGGGSTAWAINNHGQVAGNRGGGGYLWDATSGVRNLGHLNILDAYGTPHESTGESVYGLNDSAQIIGSATANWTGSAVSHAFIWDPINGMRDLNTLIPTNSGWVLEYAWGINNSGQIVGRGQLNGQTRGFLLTLIGGPPPGSLAPSAPVQSAPANDATNLDPGSVVLAWNPSIDPQGDAVEYCATVLELTESGNNPAVYTGCDQQIFRPETWLALPALEYGKTYLWTVYAQDSIGYRSNPSGWWFFSTRIKNDPPELAAIGNQTTAENEVLTFTVSATDPNAGDVLTYSAENLPDGASFDPDSQTFSWQPTYEQAGNYPEVRFCVQDNGSPLELDCETITVTVGNVNRPPVFASPLPATFTLKENEPLVDCFVRADDPDRDAITYEAERLPVGASFDPSTGKVTWTPNVAQSGAYTLRFFARDNGTPSLTTSLDVVVTVNDVPATQRAHELVNAIVELNLADDIEHKLVANLKLVPILIIQGNVEAASSVTRAAIHKIEQEIKHNTITTEVGEALLDQAYGLLVSLPSRLNEVIDLMGKTAIGQELWPYLEWAVERNAIEFKSLNSRYGETKGGWLNVSLDKNELVCVFDLKVNLEKTEKSVHKLASTLVHELTHVRDAIAANNSSTKTLNIGETEINAWANGYLYFLQMIERGGQEGQDAQAALNSLPSIERYVMMKCYAYVYYDHSDAAKIEAWSALLLLPLHSESYLKAEPQFYCTENY